MGISMLIMAIIGGWLLLSVAVCLGVGIGIRHADAREARSLPQPIRAREPRPVRPLPVA